MADRSDDTPPRTLANLLLRSAPAKRPNPQPDPQPPRPPSGQAGQLDLLFSQPSRPATPPTAQAATPPPPAGTTPARPAPKPAPTRRIFSVAELVGDVRLHLERGYQNVWLSGEISNCRPAPSGHVYFTLKDGEAQLSVVLFRRQAQLLRFNLRDGMEVLARGRVSLYESRGQLQLIAESLEPRGIGSLQFAFEQLKARLQAEGLFDRSRKRPLPPFPHCIGVVTSTRGAVLHDIIKVIRRRHACLDLLVFPARMQGPECPSTVAAGVRWFNRAVAEGAASVDIILIARGGGSLEDLAGFNDEALARTIAASKLPVVSAIGHETDFTIADFVADLRAPTPSAAAEIITATQHRIEERVTGLTDRLHRAIRYRHVVASQRLSRLSAPQILARVRDLMGRRTQRVDDLQRRLESALTRTFQRRADRLATLAARLAQQQPETRLLGLRRRLEIAERSLPLLAASRIAVSRTRLHQASARLAALYPLAVLDRGYALVYGPDGMLLRDSASVQPGETLRARLARGALSAQVTRTET